MRSPAPKSVAMLGVAVAVAWSTLARAQQPERIVIGAIDFFGTTGVDVAAIRAALPIKTGDTIVEAELGGVKARVNETVKTSTGRPATDVAGVCCGDRQRILVYIGLPGANARAIQRSPAPNGSSCLPASARGLYNDALTALQRAIESGATGEDHSRGYALSDDAGYRERQLAMRDYAVAHAPLLQAALKNCRRAEDREAAAQLLGYADQSRSTVDALTKASHDSASAVRNNAVRALWVLASSRQPARRFISFAPFVAMLNSDAWEDRNKAGLLLSSLTEPRDSTLLRQLRTEAFDSLVEMARWQDRPHADPYRVILGRIAGIEETQLLRLVGGGQVEEIIAAAVAAKN